jgi:hypothetical protein
MFENETHFHKWERMQDIEPKGSQVHSHLENDIRARVLNIQSLSRKGEQAPNWAPRYY